MKNPQPLRMAVTCYDQQIVAAHTAATSAMRDAVGHAIRAGELLTKAKASMPHGSFGTFCASLPFAATTARAYMRLAALDPANRQRVADMPLRLALQNISAKSDAQVALNSFGEVPRWVPPSGHWCVACTESAAYWVVPALEPVGYFHISKLYMVGEESFFDGTKRPVHASDVEIWLEHVESFEPSTAEWKTREKPAEARPFGEPEDAYARRR